MNTVAIRHRWNVHRNKMLIALLAIMLFGIIGAFPSAAHADGALSAEELDRIDSYIQDRKQHFKAPGLYVAVLKEGEVVFQKGYGYANVKEKTPITPETSFELGSTSKAFTALGILTLRDKGLVELNAPVRDYLPWLEMKYKGVPADVTISQLLYQTSGIPDTTLVNIPVSEADDALEQTVRTLVGLELEQAPGERFVYATINYDVLGLVIQEVSGQLYEDYMKENVLEPLGLHQTYLYREDASHMATGYKFGFGRALEYEAPTYRGNTPAAYYITNGSDMIKWANIQLGFDGGSSFKRELMDEALAPDYTVPVFNYAYAMGWALVPRGGEEYFHAGSNPNFQSFITFRPEEKLAVVALSNTSGYVTEDLSSGLMSLLMDRPITKQSDSFQGIDRTASIITYILVPFIAAILFLIGRIGVQLLRGARFRRPLQRSDWLGFVISLLFVAAFTYCLYLIPDVFYREFDWKTVMVWASVSIPVATGLAFVAGLLFYIYYMMLSLFPKPDEKPYFSLLVLSIASGLGNAVIIFMVNEAITRYSIQGTEGATLSGLVWFFALGIVLYVYGQKMIRTRLVIITNDMIYNKRMEIISLLLKTPFYKFEKTEKENVYACLNNDTERVSSFADVIVNTLTAVITLIFCFIYLGSISFYGFLSFLAILLVAGIFYYFIGTLGNQLYNRVRDIQNVFFKFITDLVEGMKELTIHRQKSKDFEKDMGEACNDYRRQRSKADLMFANIFVIGEMLFILVLGMIVFFYPIWFTGFGSDVLRSYVFVFLYLVAPINFILGQMPQLFQLKISWERIQNMHNELAALSRDEAAASLQVQDQSHSEPRSLDIQLEDVEYEYNSTNGDSFKVGPISLALRSGEITFISGGNGSGKSTLAKLITGLYKPSAGRVLVNQLPMDEKWGAESFSAIFSDVYLFDKLYGIDFKQKEEEIRHYLQLLQLDQKVQVNDGVFSTTTLSTGQRKRLALLIAYLEDRPIFLLDEWAADQDPEYRQYFYEVLLPELRARGKCVIAITHDDRYFHIADQLIKMETGKIVNQTSTPLSV